MDPPLLPGDGCNHRAMKEKVGSQHRFSTEHGHEPDPTATARIDRYDPEKLIAELKRELKGGMRLGRYIVIEHVGAGGAGIVYRAYDSKLRREVALKQLRTGALDARSEARLLREAQAMAQLSHPNVISVFDVESTKNGLVLAMEYVDGETLRSWMRKDRSWREVLDAFIQAGEGLAEAHRAGLIHRDFKPTNVLMAEGRARVMDFGLARLAMLERTAAETGRSASSVDLGDSLESFSEPLTAQGMLMGTPVYMAPEQHHGEPLDPRTDQFSFCVALWEGLCSTRPFKGNLARLEKAKDEGPPPWPKDVRVPGWLSAAVRRGLEPSAEKRWPTMDALLEHLRGRTDRHRNGWTAGTALGMVAAGFPTAWAWQAVGADECTGARAEIEQVWTDDVRSKISTALVAVGQGHGEESWSRVEGRIDRWVEQWVWQHRDACEATTVRAEQSALIMDRAMICLDRAKRELEWVTSALVDLDKRSALEAVDLVDSLPSLERCGDVEALLADAPEPSDPELATEVTRRRDVLARARVLATSGRGDEAWSVLEEVLEDVESLDAPTLHVETWQVAGQIQADRGNYEQAQSLLRRAYRLAVELDHAQASFQSALALTQVAGHQKIELSEGFVWADSVLGLGRRIGPKGLPEALALSALGSIHQRAARYDDAVARLSESVELFEQLPEELRKQQGPTLTALGDTLYRQGQYERAEALFERSSELVAEHYGSRHPNVAAVYDNLGSVYSAQGKLDDALAIRLRALEIRETALGRLHPSTGVSFHNVANVHFRLGKYDEAAEGYRRALLAWKSSLGDHHPHVAAGMQNLGNVALAQGRLEQAQQRYQEALESRTARLGEKHPDVANSLQALSFVALERGELARGREHIEEALEIRRGALGEEHDEVAYGLATLARVALAQGRLGEAERVARQAREIAGEHTPPDVRQEIEFVSGLVAEKRGDTKSALAHLQRTLESSASLGPSERAELLFALGRVTWVSAEDRDDARRFVKEAHEVLEQASLQSSGRAQAIRTWLDAHP